MRIQHFLIGWMAVLLVSCTQKTVDFQYKPSNPRAGQAIAFNNLSNTGEEWSWNFGDNTTSSSKSPVKIYKQAGTYTVMLKVDNKNSLTRVKEVTIYDSVPGFYANFVDSVGLGIFEDATFTASIYNPFNYNITLDWDINPQNGFVPTDTSNTQSIGGYFRQAAEYTVSLRIRYDERDTTVTHTYNIHDVPAEALLMRTQDQDYAQRLFGTRTEEVKKLTYIEGKELLDAAIEGEQSANRRVYQYGSDGLYVSFPDGTDKVCITENAVYAILADVVDNRIYWAESDSVMYLPLIDTPNNHFNKKATTINTLVGVKRLAKDNQARVNADNK